MRLMTKLPHLLAALILLACLLLVLTLALAPIPSINLDYGETTISLSADRAWTLYPGDCATIRWDMRGIQSLYIDGAGKIGAGEIQHCQGLRASSPQFDITAQNGIFRSLSLPIPHLPDLLFYLAGFVGLIGSGLLALHFFVVFDLNRPMPLVACLIVALLLAIVGGWLRLNTTTAPHLIDERQGDLHVRFQVESQRILFPHECVDVGWSLVGAESAAFNGAAIDDVDAPGRAKHCAGDGERAALDVVSASGAQRRYSLPIASAFPAPQTPPPTLYFALFGLALITLVFAPLAYRAIRQTGRHARADRAAVAGCFVFVFALYLPFGFDSAPHWENWLVHGYFEGGTPGFFHSWIVSRFMGMVNRALAYLIHTESFVGYNLVNFLSLAGTAAVFYGILRRLDVAPVYAFLMAILFFVYPVNPLLLSMRSMLHTFSRLALLTAIYCLLDFRRQPSRLAMLGMWLALLINVATFESAYALILAVPLLWWLRERALTPRSINLTAIWYLAAAGKAAWLLLLSATNHDFYGSSLPDAGDAPESGGDGALGAALRVLPVIYRYTFVGGWSEALDTLTSGAWLLPTALLAAGVGGLAWHLSRQGAQPPSTRRAAQWLLCGTLLLIPSVGVLMWLPLYRDDLWRMHLYAALAAAPALFSLFVLLTARIRQHPRRLAAIIALSLLLIAPGISRLFLQMETFTHSAHAKARILRQVVEIAPALAPDTAVALITPLQRTDLRPLGIYELLHSDMFLSALYAIYHSDRPQVAYFCVEMDKCSFFDGGATIFTAPAPDDLLRRTLVFQLQEDLSVQLVEDPLAFFGWDMDIEYDAARLYDADAPLPPRVESMLGLPPSVPPSSRGEG